MILKQLLSGFALSLPIFLGLFWSAARADVHGLTVPSDVNSPVRLLLSDGKLQDDLSAFFQVFVGKPEECCSGKLAMAGQYEFDGQSVTFDPAFDFVAGQFYTIRTSDDDVKTGPAQALTEFRIIPKSAAVLPEVTAIYPSGPDIPENTLRFYVHFSMPMTPHLSTEFIKLVDSKGSADTAAFMTFKQELWNADRTRLTLLMDPGRIKRGVAQNLALGPALLEGESYSILVEGGWPSARGDQEAPRFTQSFTVSKALRTLPDIGLWSFQSPAASSRDPLVIHFDRPFDFSLAQGAITVLDASGQTINGTVSVENHQQVWRFQPQTEWIGTSVHLVVDARLEDVAGNNFRELLDHGTDIDVLRLDQTSISLELGPASE